MRAALFTSPQKTGLRKRERRWRRSNSVPSTPTPSQHSQNRAECEKPVKVKRTYLNARGFVMSLITWNGIRGIKIGTRYSNFVFITKDNVDRFFRVLETWQKLRGETRVAFPPNIT